MKSLTSSKQIPQTFQKEVEILSLYGITSWDSLLKITDQQINQILKGKVGSVRNIKRLRFMAIFICVLDVGLDEAALLMQSGVSSIKSLAGLTPEELVQRTGRIERSLKTGRKPLVDLKTAFLWIQKAKEESTK